MRHERPMTRRDVFHASAVMAGMVLLEGLGGCWARAGAPRQTSAPPVVDRLAVRVVVDSYHDAMVRRATVGNVDVQRVGLIFGTSLKKHLHHEFGLSLHLASVRGGETRHGFRDFGFTPGAWLNNLDILQIDPAWLDALMVSHGHFDHLGGFVPFLQQYRPHDEGRAAALCGGRGHLLLPLGRISGRPARELRRAGPS